MNLVSENGPGVHPGALLSYECCFNDVTRPRALARLGEKPTVSSFFDTWSLIGRTPAKVVACAVIANAHGVALVRPGTPGSIGFSNWIGTLKPGATPGYFLLSGRATDAAERAVQQAGLYGQAGSSLTLVDRGSADADASVLGRVPVSLSGLVPTAAYAALMARIEASVTRVMLSGPTLEARLETPSVFHDVDKGMNVPFDQCKCRVHLPPLVSAEHPVDQIGCSGVAVGTHPVVRAAADQENRYCHAEAATRQKDRRFLVDVRNAASVEMSPKAKDVRDRYASDGAAVGVFGAGYCYLRVIEPGIRWRVARVCGPNPLLLDCLLMIHFAGVRNAVASYVVDGSRDYIHFRKKKASEPTLLQAIDRALEFNRYVRVV